MSKGQLGVIHTNSSYTPGISAEVSGGDSGDFSTKLNLSDAINHLRNKELQFYQSFFPGVSSLEEFLSKVRELFKNSESDRQILEGFKNENLQKLLPNYKPPVFERGYVITIIGDGQLIDFSALGSQFVECKDKIAISVVPENAQLIKRMLNIGLGRQSGFNAFGDNDKITRNLTDTLKLGESDSKTIGGVFKVEVSKTPIQREEKIFDVVKFAAKSNGEGYWSKNDLQSIKNTPEYQQAVGEITNKIKDMRNFLFKDYGRATEPMKKAMNVAWNSCMGNSMDVLARDFFFEGENYVKTLLGQIGEFSNLVLVNYLEFSRQDSKLPPKLMQIIGSEFESGQQYHSDIEIMTACGADISYSNMQTKNISNDSQMPVNTNASLIAPNFGDGFVTPLVNFFANTDYAATTSINEFENILNKFYYAAMNFNINDELNQKQMNTFYFMGGQHLVPASRILETLDLRTKTPNFEITGGRVVSYSNEEYKENFGRLLYWKYKKGHNSGIENMESTDDNISAYNDVATKISIKTSFSIPGLLNSGNFSIFS